MVYVVVFAAETYQGSYTSAQIACCFFPPLALQIASGAFQRSYDGISTGTIGGIMVCILSFANDYANYSLIKLFP